MRFQLFCVSCLVLVVIHASPYPKYKGCFKDGDPRDLTQKVFHKGGSVRGCVKKCRALRFMNAGIQFSYLCFCGNTSGRYGRLPDSACNSPCRKKRDKICGGEWANAIYDTGYRKYKPKKWKPRNNTETSNTTSLDAGSGVASQEIINSGSSADGVYIQETSAQEPIVESTIAQEQPSQHSNLDSIASLGSAEEMLASLGTGNSAQSAVPVQDAMQKAGSVEPSAPKGPPIGVTPSKDAGTANTSTSELTPEQMLSAL